MFYSIKECKCQPWDFVHKEPRETICDPAGNDCFWTKMDNFTHLKDNCFCLPSCYDIQYSSTERQILQFDGYDCYNENFDINAKESYLNYTPRMEIMLRSSYGSYGMGSYHMENLMEYFAYHKKCKDIQMNDISIVEVRIDGQSYMKYVQTKRVSNTDKIGSVGGTLGVCFGFSFLAVAELLYWICRTILPSRRGCDKGKENNVVIVA